MQVFSRQNKPFFENSFNKTSTIAEKTSNQLLNSRNQTHFNPSNSNIAYEPIKNQSGIHSLGSQHTELLRSSSLNNKIPYQLETSKNQNVSKEMRFRTDSYQDNIIIRSRTNSTGKGIQVIRPSNSKVSLQNTFSPLPQHQIDQTYSFQQSLEFNPNQIQNNNDSFKNLGSDVQKSQYSRQNNFISNLIPNQSPVTSYIILNPQQKGDQSHGINLTQQFQLKNQTRRPNINQKQILESQYFEISQLIDEIFQKQTQNALLKLKTLQSTRHRRSYSVDVRRFNNLKN